MKNIKKQTLIIVAFGIIILTFVIFQLKNITQPRKISTKDIPTYSTTHIYVQDNAKLLTNDEINQLQANCEKLYKEKEIQLVFLTINKIPDNYTIESYTNAVFNNWGIGDKNTNKGLLMVYAKSNDMLRLEVGYGLEGDIPDIEASKIIKNIRPLINNREYCNAFNLTINCVTNKNGESSVNSSNTNNSDKNTMSYNGKIIYIKDLPFGNIIMAIGPNIAIPIIMCIIFIIATILLMNLFNIIGLLLLPFVFLINLCRCGFNMSYTLETTKSFMKGYKKVTKIIQRHIHSSGSDSGSSFGGSSGGGSFGGGSSGGGGASG